VCVKDVLCCMYIVQEIIITCNDTGQGGEGRGLISCEYRVR
jgi:hypothetical protein